MKYDFDKSINRKETSDNKHIIWTMYEKSLGNLYVFIISKVKLNK